jgi:hypothetical protein
MNGILSFIVAVIWGSLSAQFLVQVVTSFAITLVYLAAIISAKVSRVTNCAGALTSFLQSIMFGIFFSVETGSPAHTSLTMPRGTQRL